LPAACKISCLKDFKPYPVPAKGFVFRSLVDAPAKTLLFWWDKLK